MTDPLLSRALRAKDGSRRSPALDTAVRWVAVLLGPIVITILATHELAYNAAPWDQWMLVLVMAWILVFRRRAPVIVFGADFVILLALLALDVETIGALTMLVAIYSVAAHRSARFSIGAIAVLELGVLLFALRFAPSGSIGDAVTVLSGLAAGALFLGTTFRAQRRYLASVEDRAVRVEREQAQLAELSAAAERARIAREMHDIVAHGLSVVITLAEGAAEATPADAGPGREAMKQVAAAGRQSLSEMRNLLHVLRTDEGDARRPQPDLAALATVIDDVRRTGLDIHYRAGAGCDALGATIQATLYRIVQESLTNVLKHAPGARVVSVDLECDDTLATFAIADDGGAPSTRTPPRTPSGNGILGMKERAALFGGDLEAAAETTGWTVRGSLSVR